MAVFCPEPQGGDGWIIAADSSTDVRDARAGRMASLQVLTCPGAYVLSRTASSKPRSSRPLAISSPLSWRTSISADW